MIITGIYPIAGEIVETDECDYIRYAADNWCVRMGESIEPVYLEEEELERCYQQHKRDIGL